jgi:hypothetical protein
MQASPSSIRKAATKAVSIETQADTARSQTKEVRVLGSASSVSNTLLEVLGILLSKTKQAPVDES